MSLITNTMQLQAVDTPHGLVEFKGPYLVADATEEQAAFLFELPGYKKVLAAAATSDAPPAPPAAPAAGTPAASDPSKSKATTKGTKATEGEGEGGEK